MTWPRALCILLLLLPAAALAQPTTLIDFELEDQFRRTYRGSDYAGRVLYVIGSDKDGSRYNGLWAQAIAEALAEEPSGVAPTTFGVADLSGVPFFLKGMIRRKFPQQPEEWVLMDWRGRFTKAYSFEPGAANILVFAPDGRLAHQTHGREVAPPTLAAVVASLRELLASAGS